MIQEHDCIVLTQDIPEEGLRTGDVGTVVHIHGDDAGYQVEFMTLSERLHQGIRRSGSGQKLEH